jgi:hypothetical protein
MRRDFLGIRYSIIGIFVLLCGQVCRAGAVVDFSGTLNGGGTFSGSLGYQTPVAPSFLESGTPSEWIYDVLEGPVQLNLPNLTAFSADSSWVGIVFGVGGVTNSDIFQVEFEQFCCLSLQGSAAAGLSGVSVTFVLSVPADILTPDEVFSPLPPVSPASSTFELVGVSPTDTDAFTLQGTLTSLTVSSVPEPKTGVLVSVPLVALGAWFLRRRGNARSSIL